MRCIGPKVNNDDAIEDVDQEISSIKPIVGICHASDGIAAIGRIPVEEELADLTKTDGDKKRCTKLIAMAKVGEMRPCRLPRGQTTWRSFPREQATRML